MTLAAIRQGKLDKGRLDNAAFLSPFGRVLPSQTRTIWAPPDSYVPGTPGMCRRYLGLAGSVTSTIEVPFGSALPVIGFTGDGMSSVPP